MATTTYEQDKKLTIPELAAYIGMSPAQTWRYVRQKKIRSHQPGGDKTKRWVLRSDADAFLAKARKRKMHADWQARRLETWEQCENMPARFWHEMRNRITPDECNPYIREMLYRRERGL